MSLVHDPSRGTPLDVRYLQAPSSASNGTPQSMPMARYWRLSLRAHISTGPVPVVRKLASYTEASPRPNFIL